MKVISIGRSPENMIIVDDMMVSRRHAFIRISPLGKYELVSLGANGTKVNGNQVAPNVPYPLKRGDSVIFANVAPLNWSCVPDPLRPYKIGLISLCVALVAIFAVIAVVKIVGRYTGLDSDSVENVGSGTTEPADSTLTPDIKLRDDSVKSESDGKDIPFEQRFNAENQSDKKSNRSDSKSVKTRSIDAQPQEEKSEATPQAKAKTDSVSSKKFRR